LPFSWNLTCIYKIKNSLYIKSFIRTWKKKRNLASCDRPGYCCDRCDGRLTAALCSIANVFHFPFSFSFFSLFLLNLGFIAIGKRGWPELVGVILRESTVVKLILTNVVDESIVVLFSTSDWIPWRTHLSLHLLFFAWLKMDTSLF